MKHFPLPLRGEFVDNGRRVRLTAPFVFEDGDECVEVLEGFVCDFNSVPRLLWSWFPPWQYPGAGVIHDWLYQHPGGRTRKRCDEIHRRILHLDGCRKSKRVAVYLGIRAGGRLAWATHRAREVARV